MSIAEGTPTVLDQLKAGWDALTGKETPPDATVLAGVKADADKALAAALLTAAGIPAICFGPGDIGLAHSAEEYVDMGEIERATGVLAGFVSEWFGGES